MQTPLCQAKSNSLFAAQQRNNDDYDRGKNYKPAKPGNTPPPNEANFQTVNLGARCLNPSMSSDQRNGSEPLGRSGSSIRPAAPPSF